MTTTPQSGEARVPEIPDLIAGAISRVCSAQFILGMNPRDSGDHHDLGVKAGERVAELKAAISSAITQAEERGKCERIELSMLVSRLCSRIRSRYNKSDEVAARSLDYLRRKGFQGSPLRAARASQPNKEHGT